MKKLANKVAVVTGAGSGIGRCTAEAFARRGMTLVLADIDGAGLAESQRLIASTGAKAFIHSTDVSDADSIRGLYQFALSRAGGVHLMMNNAGISRFGPALELSDDDWQRVIDVNLWGVVHGCRIFGSHFVEQGEGHIVNTASVCGLSGLPTCASYVTAKFGVVGLSEALRWELAPDGVGVTVVCPGLVKTNIVQGVKNGAANQQAIRRFGGRAEELAEKIARAVQRDQARVLFGYEPQVSTILRRLSPGLHDALGRVLGVGALRRLRSMAAEDGAGGH